MREIFTIDARVLSATIITLIISTMSLFSSPAESNLNSIKESQGTEVQQTSTTKTSFLQDFEGATFPPDGWTMYSLLETTLTWELNLWQNYTPGGTQSAYHNSTSEPESVDNWLVTPAISIAADGLHYLSFWSFLGNSWAYKKNSVLVSTGSSNPADEEFVELWAGISNDGWIWANYFIDLQAYIGQEIYIAFRYEGDQWGHNWNVDDVTLVDDSPIIDPGTLEVTQALAVNGAGSQHLFINNLGILDLTYEIDIVYINSDGWLTADPVSGTVSTNLQDTVSLNFDATGLEPGTYQANLNITGNDPVNPLTTVLVTMEVVNVNVYPFVENFESETFPPIGWSMYNVDGDQNQWAQSWFNNTPAGQYSALHSFGWDNQDGWLVTPQITVPEEGFFYLSFWNYDGYTEFYGKNSVLISTASGVPGDGDFVELWTPETITETWTQSFINLQDYAGEDIYIAFRYEGANAHYWGIDDISLGEEIDDSPLMNISISEIAQTVGEEGSGSKTFEVINDGIQNLTFDIEIEFTDGNDWLTVDPVTGSIGAKSGKTITLAFDAAGLEIGTYQANIVITGNDTENPTATVVATLNVMEAQPVSLTTIYPEYTVPTRISTDGRYVSGSQFGGKVGYLWTQFEGRVDIPGDITGVSDNGQVVGTYETEFMFDGLEVQTAGRWNSATQEWEFLGMNPEVPEITSTSYNAAWGISADGATVVGLQFTEGWSAKAFKWTETDGYEMIGPAEYDSRASGISDDGSVIFGWASPNWSWSPVVWHNDEMIFIDDTQANFGESTAASANGNYVAGYMGTSGFLWSPTEGITLFENTINLGSLRPTAILEDGTIFGYTAEGFPPTPPDRRTFVRHPDGTMQTFNEYVADRGWFDASDWIFFSVFDVTPDGNKFVGAAELPTGEWTSFLLDLEPGTPIMEINALEINETLYLDETSTHTIGMENLGDGYLQYSALVQYIIADPRVQTVPVGDVFKSGELALAKKAFTAGNAIPEQNSTKNTTLAYDGENVDAIGLLEGGTFYGAVRFPSEMVAVYENYEIESIEAYIGDIPSAMKLMIWDAGTTTTAGTLLYEQSVTPEQARWNTITLDNPVKISGSDIWIGFEITHNQGTYILGIDNGPANSNSGWLSTDAIEWEQLINYELNSNWNIRANLTFNGFNWLSINPASGIMDELQTAEMTVSIDTEGLETGSYTANIRISSNDAENSLVVIPVNLTLQQDVTSVEDMQLFSINVFPNPASSIVNIASEFKIGQISVLNLIGQKVYESVVNDQNISLDVSEFNDGMYSILLFTNNGVYTKVFQVVK